MAGRGRSFAVSVSLAYRVLLYLDEDSQATDVVRLLRAALMDVLTSTEGGMDGKSDEAQLAFAAANGRAIFTGNVGHFRRLNREYQELGRSHQGIILWEQSRLSVGERARRLIRLWESVSALDMVNREEFLSRWGDDSVHA